jgi:hypothetical protein
MDEPIPKKIQLFITKSAGQIPQYFVGAEFRPNPDLGVTPRHKCRITVGEIFKSIFSTLPLPMQCVLLVAVWAGRAIALPTGAQCRLRYAGGFQVPSKLIQRERETNIGQRTGLNDAKETGYQSIMYARLFFQPEQPQYVNRITKSILAVD